MALQQCLKGRRDRRLIGEVEGGHTHSAAMGAQIGCQGIECILGPRNQQKVPTLSGQLFCGSPAKATTSTSDQSCRQALFANRCTLRGLLHGLRCIIDDPPERTEFAVARIAQLCL